jgi:glycerophosphoryl diester phosphodiesterase
LGQKLIILSHRGYWHTTDEKNTPTAFKRSFAMGFGTETDIRDYKGKLVISHDMADEKSLSLDSFFEIYTSYKKSLPLALNIKSDGLHSEVKRLLLTYDIKNYFVFDMAVPDGLLYVKQQITTFTRQSEFEVTPAFYELANGVWLDEFKSHWITGDVIQKHIKQEKSICIVSPELHKRPYLTEWQHYKQISMSIGQNLLMICTDYPEQAQEFFHAKN